MQWFHLGPVKLQSWFSTETVTLCCQNNYFNIKNFLFFHNLCIKVVCMLRIINLASCKHSPHASASQNTGHTLESAPQALRKCIVMNAYYGCYSIKIGCLVYNEFSSSLKQQQSRLLNNRERYVSLLHVTAVCDGHRALLPLLSRRRCNTFCQYNELYFLL